MILVKNILKKVIIQSIALALAETKSILPSLPYLTLRDDLPSSPLDVSRSSAVCETPLWVGQPTSPSSLLRSQLSHAWLPWHRWHASFPHTSCTPRSAQEPDTPRPKIRNDCNKGWTGVFQLVCHFTLLS